MVFSRLKGLISKIAPNTTDSAAPPEPENNPLDSKPNLTEKPTHPDSTLQAPPPTPGPDTQPLSVKEDVFEKYYLPENMRENYAEIFMHNTPLIDVRSEIEFVDENLKNATNLPILSSAERALVGTKYKREGSESAVALGRELISGPVKSLRLKAWQDFIKEHPQALLVCARGGLRSRSAQMILREAGIEVPTIKGGVKALRRFLLDNIAHQAANQSFVVLSGRTGTGKSVLLNELNEKIQTLDLENIACHRGSAFGKTPIQQPPQYAFENEISLTLLNIDSKSLKGPILIEDESRQIGKLTIPDALFEKMSAAPLYLIEESKEERAYYLVKTYLEENYKIRDNEPTTEATIWRVSRDVHDSVNAILRRLGGLRAREILDNVNAAIQEQLASGKIHLHSVWVEKLLSAYYDPLYDAHIKKNEHRIALRGSRDEVKAALERLGPS